MKMREKVDHGSGERSARERACRRRNPLFLRVSYWSWISSLLPRISALSELWSASNSGVSVSWMEDAVVGVEGTSRFREVEATTALPPPVLVAERRKFLQLRRRRLKLLGGEGSFSLTSPALGSRSPTTVQEGEEESWFRRRLEGIMSSGETRVSVVWHGGLVRRSDAWRTEDEDLHTCLSLASSTHA
ncbi:hypothetical protein HID58_045791 [Brassica napus]|uniref:Uncharacterized protein n=1 Tax=Brassica napus TaxID=3708 RepID=A0ABQ8AUR7_BRANA|nr:hypothetical protein HID58_045791 [Brassica napus]